MNWRKRRTLRRGPLSRPDPSQIAVLVLDDEPGVRMVLASSLATEGYSVCLADGNNVVDALDAREYDLVISDLRMPGTDGLHALAMAKEKSPKAKLIVITGYPSQESLESCRAFGVARYLVKPFAIGEIRQVARNVLRGKNSGQEALVSNGDYQCSNLPQNARAV